MHIYFFANGLFPPHNRTIGLATKTDEKVPIITPNIIAREKSCNTSPPKKKRAKELKSTVTDVTIVLERTSLMLIFITVSTLSLSLKRRFSLILSKTTTVSVSEYPAIVRRAFPSERICPALQAHHGRLR